MESVVSCELTHIGWHVFSFRWSLNSEFIPIQEISISLPGPGIEHITGRHTHGA
ncbi:hypothetical protein O3G_MSEX013625 [Manduca sexta]|uniref:Uncharacterized protein n=1 Tax=Manduca sexta TaxID=7130 RepID=A0A922CYS3_MANSE|nr:hypothetical protein O3G_MSEX013625 [Manduca sexta]